MKSTNDAIFRPVRFSTAVSQVCATHPLGLHHIDRWIAKPSHEARALAILLALPGGFFGMDRDEEQELRELFRQAYQAITGNQELNALPSAVATTFRPVRPGEGHAFIQISSPSMADGEAIVLENDATRIGFPSWPNCY